MYSSRILLIFTKKYNNSFRNLIKQYRNLYSYHVKKTYFPSSLVFTNASRYSSDSPLKCWNCNFIYKSALFCSKCKTLQEPPESLTYFDIMGIPKSYDIIIVDIQTKYKELQKLFHPDKFGNKSEKEKQLSQNISSLVNRAYNTLLNPLQRGLYILELNNITISEGTDNMDPEFLMEIMEKNEEIEVALNDHTKIQKLTKENKEILNSLTMEIAEAFRKQDIKKAETHLIRMKYYNSINNRLKKLKHDLGIVE
ncbi:PREDICTED: iron-sulfur cluster co-chaperone protein HscB, mitochondrial [Dufourea novaeangliae]|uniref:Iron-sulfur cluster co-chaperone protein HscB, mitochondrial n=1 Tax=Dufourea novaeangliae TaxID=178035 RepID=A0A154NYJ9_DUFNO|nr:PREDICTED: iron-sulfur cluster co-chaperone protein HscB, mitochondrial [Dufourea novaeangliae]KZC04154.1 Iron-sulfur cluster co-chaperone protein HscB, mitochondrial [Dufourea novaeangliae]